MKIVFHVVLAASLALAAPLLRGADRDVGDAGYYSDWFVGKMMANGELVDQDALTASIASHAFDTILRVTNLETDKSVVVRVTDRPGPKTNELILVTRSAAEKLGILDSGRARVEIEVIEEGDGGRVESAASSEPTAKERRRERGGLAEPGKKPSPFSYSEH